MKTFLFVAAFLSICGTFAPQSTHCAAFFEKEAPKPIALTLAQVIDTCAAYYGIPKEIIIGVAISETGIGTDGVGKPSAANNLFGIRKGKYDAHPKDMTYYCSNGEFRKYNTQAESVPDFCKFIKEHYWWFWKRPRKVELWLLNGYGNSKYERRGYFCQFKDYKI